MVLVHLKDREINYPYHPLVTLILIIVHLHYCFFSCIFHRECLKVELFGSRKNPNTTQERQDLLMYTWLMQRTLHKLKFLVGATSDLDKPQEA